MRNFTELKTEVGRLAQRSDDQDYLTKIGVWLNLSHDFLYRVYDYYHELQEEYDFTSVADREDYPMPNNFDKPLRIYDIENNKKLNIITREEYFDGNIANIADVDTAIPEYAMIYGVKGITGTIGASGTTTKVKSSSTDDSGGITVRIEGYLDSAKLIMGYEDVVISTGSPTTYVAGTTTFYEITHISKSSDTAGYVTVADSSDVVLTYLSATDRIVYHKVLKLGKVPDDAYDYRVLFKKKHQIMVDDNDYPFIDADDFLILDAYGWALSQEKETVERASVIWSKAKETLAAFLNNQNSKLGPDYQHRITNAFTQAHRS